MSQVLTYELTDEEFEAARRKLAAVPKEQWPSEEMWDAVYLSVRMKAMENAEGDETDAEHG